MKNLILSLFLVSSAILIGTKSTLANEAHGVSVPYCAESHLLTFSNGSHEFIIFSPENNIRGKWRKCDYYKDHDLKINSDSGGMKSDPPNFLQKMNWGATFLNLCVCTKWTRSNVPTIEEIEPETQKMISDIRSNTEEVGALGENLASDSAFIDQLVDVLANDPILLEKISEKLNK